MIYTDHLPYLTVYMSHTVDILWDAGTTYPSQVPEFTPAFLVGSVLLIFLVFCVILLCVFALRFLHKNYVRFVYFQLFLVVRMSYLRYLCVLIVVCITYCIFFPSCWQSLSPATDRIRLDAISKWTPDHPLKTPLAKSSSISSLF